MIKYLIVGIFVGLLVGWVHARYETRMLSEETIPEAMRELDVNDVDRRGNDIEKEDVE